MLKIIISVAVLFSFIQMVPADTCRGQFMGGWGYLLTGNCESQDSCKQKNGVVAPSNTCAEGTICCYAPPQQPNTPSQPAYPNAPNVTLPDVPQAPSIPSTPNIPTVNLPQTPSVPNPPNLPSPPQPPVPAN